MKKIVIFLLTILLATSFIGCKEEGYDNVSYRHTAYLVGKSEDIKVIVQSGMRESPYVADGEAGDMVEFCTITLKPLSAEGTTKSYTYSFTVDGESFTGNMNKDVFGSGFSKDVGKDIGESLSAITFSDGEKEYPIELENMMSNAIVTETEAIDISVREFSERLDALHQEGKQSEIYAKFVCDSTGDETYYYWYVAHVFEGGEYMAVLLDIVSGDVIAKRG